MYNTGNFLTTFIHFNSNQGLEPFVEFCWLEVKPIPFSTSFIFHLACNFNFIIFLTSFIFYSKENSKGAYIHQWIPETTEMFFLKQGRLEALIPFSHLGKQKLLSVSQERIRIIRLFFFFTFYLFQINFMISKEIYVYCFKMIQMVPKDLKWKWVVVPCPTPHITPPLPWSLGIATLLFLFWYIHSTF